MTEARPGPSADRKDALLYACVLGAVMIVLAIGILATPWLAQELAPGAEGSEVLEARATVIDTTVRVVLAIVASAVAWFTLRRIRAIELQVGVAQKQLAVSESGQQTDRYSKAIEQLGAVDQVNIRIGGLYALASVATDAPDRFGQTAHSVLVAFVREQTRPQIKRGPGDRHADVEVPRVGTDVETALRILATNRRTLDQSHSDEVEASKDVGRGADLHGVDLSHRWLREADLSSADLAGAKLFETVACAADFRKADLTNATLDGANMSDAKLNGADLSRANMSGSDLTRAKLLRTGLVNTDLTDADLTDAELVGANLAGADLAGAVLIGADLEGASLMNAHLQGARCSESTRWPDEFDSESVGVITVYEAS